MNEKRYAYSDDIESIVDMKNSIDGLGIELTTSDVVLRLNQLEALQKACIEFYCGMNSKFEWRQAVRESPEGQRLIALAHTYGVK